VDYPVGSTVLKISGGLPAGSPVRMYELGVLNTTRHFMQLANYILNANGVLVGR